MALKKIGNIWHVKFRNLAGRITSLTTGEADKQKALPIHDAFMTRLKYQRQMKKRGFALLGVEQPDEAFTVAADAAMQPRTHQKRYSFDEAFELYKSHVDPLPENAEKNFKRFAIWCRCKYIDEVTPEIAYNYLLANYGSSAGKTWNNNKNSLNAIFRRIVIPAKLERSPFADVPGKPNKGEHQRAVTDEEFKLIFAEADQLWRSAAFISYWTGFRQESAFRFGPGHIENDIITIMPGKTARFNRSVQIPVHPQLKAFLATLPPSQDDTFLGFDIRKRSGGGFTRYFGELLARLDIRDNEKGIVVFNSIRNNFIERCRKKKDIPEHAIRGMVGQVTSDMTDLYSQEIESAMPVKNLPPIEVEF